MNNKQKYVIEKIAQRARKLMVDKSIIKAEDCLITDEQIAEIFRSFGGSLELKDDLRGTKIKKTKENEFVVYYCEKSSPLDKLHELGHAFFDLPSMEVGDTYPCDGTEENDIVASLFSRSFYMPRDPFEMATIRCSINGKCDVKKVAEIYNVDCFDILTRGEELNIWR